MKPFRKIEEAFARVFRAQAWSAMRGRDVRDSYCDATETSPEEAGRLFEELVASGVIERRGGWYTMKPRELSMDAPPAPPRPPQDILHLKAFVTEKFPRTGQSNPMHFCILAGLPLEPRRLGDIRYTLRELVKDGLLEKLLDGEEYRWCGPVEEAAQPPPRPATPPPPKPMSKEYDAWAGSHPVAGSDEWYIVRATSEALCREVVWRLAQRRVPGPCAEALMQALEFAPGTKGEEP